MVIRNETEGTCRERVREGEKEKESGRAALCEKKTYSARADSVEREVNFERHTTASELRLTGCASNLHTLHQIANHCENTTKQLQHNRKTSEFQADLGHEHVPGCGRW